MNQNTAFKLLSIYIASIACIASTMSQNPISIEDLHKNYIFYPESPNNIQPSADGEHYTSVVDDTKIVEYSFKTGKMTSTLLDLSTIEECKVEHIDGYEISSLGTHILLHTNKTMIYRRSFEAEYYIYDIRYKTLEPLYEKGPLQSAIFSPNGAMVAFVFESNIYIKKLRYNSTSPITKDGDNKYISNGVADWAYEEDFYTTEAMKWSPDSKELAYIRFDKKGLHFNEITYYNSSISSSEDISNKQEYHLYEYPLTGDSISSVSVNVFNVNNRTTKTMQTGDEKEYYIPRISWSGADKELVIMKVNRRQNQLDILLGNSASTVCNAVFTDREDQYIEPDVLDNYLFLPDGQHFLYTGELDGYRHIYLFAKNGVQIAQLTKGNFDVTKLLGYDPATKKVFYQAAKESPTEREIYSVSTDKLITTKLSSRKGTNNATFNSNCKYFINQFSSTDTPPIYTICNALGQEIRTLEDNNVLKTKLAKYNFYKKEFFTVNTADGTPLNGWMVKPQNWNNGDKYPLLIVQYNGPNIQEVLNKWDIDWEQTLADNGYIVACIDTRGTGARGEEFRKCTYQHLGRQESNDLIDAAKWLGSQPYIDSKRIGLWGWSYGGYMTSLCMCKSGIFKMGISVAGVSNWKYYNSIYTERYMRKPQENISGYTSENPIDLAENLSGRLFLIHGTADDNVLIQNHMDLVTKLIENNKQFDTFIYPNKNHSIYGGNTRNHLYTMMLDYIKRNL